ncbi:MAG: mitofilin family membrane protein [Rhizomicrobium sp.]
MSATDSVPPPPPAHTVHVVHPSRWQGLGAVAMLVGMVIVLGVTGLFLWSMNQNRAQPLALGAGESGDVASLRDRLASDEARLAALERGGPGDGLKSSLAQAQGDLASLSARVGKLETAPYPQTAARLDEFDRRLAAMRADGDLRLAALERNALGSDLPQRIAALTSAQAALEARLSRLENIEPSVTMRRAAAELALANLVRASGEPAPFEAELETFRTLMPDAREAGALAPIALRGAPTQATLAQRFPTMAAKALAAEKAGRASTWLGRLWANLGNVIVVRRIGDVAGEDSESILARAGAKLNDGDLTGAVREMTGLKGAARASAQGWLGEAQARLAIARATKALAHRLALLLAAP